MWVSVRFASRYVGFIVIRFKCTKACGVSPVVLNPGLGPKQSYWWILLFAGCLIPKNFVFVLGVCGGLATTVESWIHSSFGILR